MKYLFVVLLPFLSGLLIQDIKINNLVKTNNQIGLLLYKELREIDDNILFSPLSLLINLAMLYNGEKLSVDENVLQFDEDIHRSFDYLINNRFKDSSLEIANGILFQKSLQINQSYLEDLLYYYNPLIAFVNFQEISKIQNYINNWVSMKTHNHIKSIDLSIDHYTTLIMLNAIYFKGKWLVQFNQKYTHHSYFQNRNNVSDVQMMKTKGIFRYAFNQQLDTDILELPYINDDISMFILMPRKISGMANLEDHLSSDFLDEIFCHLTSKFITVLMPKFKLESSYELSKYNKNLNFEGMIHGLYKLCNCNEIMLDGMFQKIKLIVDEKGTEAVAITLSKLALSAYVSEFQIKIDKPFIFVIRDSITGLFLFFGKIENL